MPQRTTSARSRHGEDGIGGRDVVARILLRRISEPVVGLEQLGTRNRRTDPAAHALSNPSSYHARGGWGGYRSSVRSLPVFSQCQIEYVGKLKPRAYR